ncbi:MAG: class I SAM-dependent methyltransferase [Crocinitomicaceae bacterium]|nr:class I SAM-dependent methyltransferase [Crocinitomicaceae bacterium]NCA22152.1 class I SAM-dependent methyltransferase [Crocinitomicaceae bacterium]
MNEKEWFAEWFDTTYYHQLYQNRNEEEAVLFISNLLQFLNLPKSSSLLDLACGKGRHSVTLNSFDYKVLGVDLAANSIQAASKFENETLSFATHDMREVIEGKTFDAIFNLFTSFGYFDNESENEKVCASISKMLSSKGKLVIDFMNAEKVIQKLVQSETKRVGELDFHLERRYDGNHIFKDIRFHDNGRDFHFTERVQGLKLEDFKRLLEQEFTILATFGSFDLQPFSASDSDRLIIIAEKKS